MFYFPLQDSIKQFKKFLSPEIHAAADLLDPVVNGNPGTQTKSEASGIHVGKKQPAIPANLRLDNSFDGLEMLH